MKGSPVFFAVLLTGLVVGGFAVFPSNLPNAMAHFSETESGQSQSELPFTLRLDETVVLDEWSVEPALHLQGAGGGSEVLAEKGRELSLASGGAVVKSVGPWSGLYPDARGNAMAALALDFDEGGQGDAVGIRDGEWLRVGTDTAIHFRWTSSEEQARKRLADTPASMDSARWGAVDGRTVHWFSSFARGEGTRLRSGDSLFLLDFDMNWRDADRPGLGGRPAVQIRGIAGEVVYDQWYPAEANQAGVPVIFEYPASRKRLLILCAWNEEETLAGAYQDGQQTQAAKLQPGSAWRPEGSEYTLRWRRALRGAVFVPLEDSPFVAATLRYGEREIYVRQGEALRIEDYTVRFSPGKRLEAYRVSILRRDGSHEQALLQPGAPTAFHIKSEGNRYVLRHENVHPGEGVEVEVLPRWHWPLMAAGATLLIVGMMGSAVSQRRTHASV